MIKHLATIIFVMLMVSISACSTAGQGNPVEAVEKYLQAKVEGNQDALAPLLCAELEATLDREARTFATVTGVRIEGMSCTYDESTSIVDCDGEIIATYGADDTNFPLTSYRVVQEDGEWKWCGEA